MVLLLIVAVPLFFSAGFIIRQQVVKYQMREQLSLQQLQTITLPAANAKWLNEDQEIIIEGKLFDVQSYQIVNDNLIVTGLFDEDEDKLNKKIQDFVERENDTPSPLDNLVLEFFSTPFYNNTTDFCSNPNWRYINTAYYNYSEAIPSAPFLADNRPPKL